VQKDKGNNFFDDLINQDHAEAMRQDANRRAEGHKIDYLIHQIFKQTEEGRELLKVWSDTLIMQPTAEDGMDMVAIGIREGQKRMIRGIVLTINRVEGE
jgi:hypothetical protein